MTMTDEDIKYVLNVLRRGTITWSGRSECLRRARKRVRVGTYLNGNPKFKFHWQCADCKTWYSDEKSLEVDHIVEVGPFCGDWNNFIARCYPRPVEKTLQALCQTCHLKKTLRFTNALREFKRKK